MKDDLSIAKFLPLVTPRLLIDRFRPDDWKDFYEIEISREQHQFNHETYSPKTENQVEESIQRLSERNYDDRILPMQFAIREKGKTKLIGFFGLKNGELKENGAVEVFYTINKDYCNNGYGTETLRRMIVFGFESISLHRIFSGCDFENFASKRVMEKAGMRFESRWRQDRIRNGRWTDGLGFAIIDEDILLGETYTDII
jgi:[ribosomal protein S5]-alanine N-acetyltransferase